MWQNEHYFCFLGSACWILNQHAWEPGHVLWKGRAANQCCRHHVSLMFWWWKETVSLSSGNKCTCTDSDVSLVTFFFFFLQANAWYQSLSLHLTYIKKVLENAISHCYSLPSNVPVRRLHLFLSVFDKMMWARSEKELCTSNLLQQCHFLVAGC